MGDRKLGGKPVYVVEVTVGLVLVLLLEFCIVEVLVVERSGMHGSGLSLRGRRLGSLGGMEGTASGSRTSGSGGRRLASGLVGLERVGAVLGGGELLSHLCGGESLAGMGTHCNVVRVDADALVLVYLVDVDVAGDARVASDHLAGAHDEGGAHDGALGGLLSELGEGGETRGRRGA